MMSYHVDVFWILLVFSFSSSSGCVLNDCICALDGLFCEQSDTAVPSLMDYELDLIEYVQITDTQIEWIVEVCSDFTRLEHVYMLDGSACPSQLCVDCK